MNSSALNNSSIAVVPFVESFSTAVGKNVFLVALCISINYVNATLVHTFRKHEVFNSNPRYILFIHLVINDTTQLVMATMLHVFSYTFKTIALPFCTFMLMIAIMVTFNTPLNLASMAVECYIAVCIPLRHLQICTVRKTYILISLIWLVSLLIFLSDFFLILATEPLGFYRSKVLCIRDHVFTSSLSQQKRDVSHIVCLVVVWLTLVYTYFKILLAAKGATANARKAQNTILLHGLQLLLCMLTYVRPLVQRGLMFLMPTKYANIRFACYVTVQILPRIISPMVYGLRDQTFRTYAWRYLFCTAHTDSQLEHLDKSGKTSEAHNHK